MSLLQRRLWRYTVGKRAGPATSPPTVPLPKPEQHQATNSADQNRFGSLACRPSCSLAYFQPRRVRLDRFPGAPFVELSSRPSGPNAQPLSPLIDLLSQALTFALNGITVPHQRCEMKNPTSVAELHTKLGAPSSETVESLRLLTAFLKLAPGKRFEIIELVQRLATDPAAASDHSS